ncbi:hypothetical protein CHY_0241 [Carboxydothermus hydrogenoformans Z-2901]|uniref:Uncharacterized protein n=1 Tax=Carboxydothermus hydrogenoformans (strain ATCC BAA-161 / DSM 6008 / Z-2901) TaxID=246194 RepID=Q3AFH1_CARHZ|nr:hypothetical protein CHY_0241 [Carboxydothermus hydrogenoformans Z-2901]
MRAIPDEPGLDAETLVTRAFQITNELRDKLRNYFL